MKVETDGQNTLKKLLLSDSVSLDSKLTLILGWINRALTNSALMLRAGLINSNM